MIADDQTVRPTPVPMDHMNEVCIPASGAAVPCRYIAISIAGGLCQKMTNFRVIIDRVVADEEPVPVGDNCPGWPPEARVQ